MAKIELKHYHGNVLFSHKCENNTVKKTFLAAIEKSTNLKGLCLIGEDLSNIKIASADFTDACFYGSLFENAEIIKTKFDFSNLVETSFFCTKLQECSLANTVTVKTNFDCASFINTIANQDFEDCSFLGTNFKGILNPPISIIPDVLREFNFINPCGKESDFVFHLFLKKLKGEINCEDICQLAKKYKMIEWVKEILSHWKEFDNLIH